MKDPNLTPELTPQDAAEDGPAVQLTMVITLRNGVQIRIGVKHADVHRSAGTGKLTGVDWVLDDDPYGSSIGYVDTDEVAAVHYERAPRQPTLDDLS